ncbi:hypothetical protein GGI07_002466 [Coemansia sp. Benny D115]|nr:hypothetical protein GGI07_002466 [Coemansia sp. Benny D115]
MPVSSPSSAKTPTKAPSKPMQKPKAARKASDAVPSHTQEPYPLFRVAVSCLFVLLCWAVAHHRENAYWRHIDDDLSERAHEIAKPFWPQLRGNVLTLGPGTADSLPHIRGGSAKTSGISKIVSVEPIYSEHAELVSNAQRLGFSLRYDPQTCPNAALQGDISVAANRGQRAPLLAIVNATFGDVQQTLVPQYVLQQAPYDYIVSSLALCSVRDIDETLQAIHGLLAPGGRLVFIEHVRHTKEHDKTVVNYRPDSLDLGTWRMAQDLWAPLRALFRGGCRMDRDTGKFIERMEGYWRSVEYKTVRPQDNVAQIMTPMIYGIATKSQAQIKVHCPNALAQLNQIKEFPPFASWLSALDKQYIAQTTSTSNDSSSASVEIQIRQIHVQSVDYFSSGKIGFVKFATEAIRLPEEKAIPGIVFLRGGAVAILLVLQPQGSSSQTLLHSWEDGESMVVLTVQPRVAVPSFSMCELPAGMLDGSTGCFAGTAARELQEETGIVVEPHELVDLGASGSEDHAGLYPSCGACDEFIRLFACEKSMPVEQLEQIKGRLGGLREDGEFISLKLVPLKDVYAATKDMKAAAALYLWDRRIAEKKKNRQ